MAYLVRALLYKSRLLAVALALLAVAQGVEISAGVVVDILHHGFFSESRYVAESAKLLRMP